LSGNLTLNGGTANGVLYLNGSKVATSGSALTFDGTEIGTTSTGLNINNANALVRYQNGSGTRTGYLQVRADAFDIWSDQAAVPMVFGVANSESMRLTSTGLGIGTTSPSSKLTVNGEISVTDNFALRLGSNQAGGATILYNGNGNLDITPRSSFNTVITTGNLGIGTSSPGGKLHVNGIGYFGNTGASDTQLRLGALDASNTYFQAISGDGTTAKGYVFYNGGSVGMTLASSGNLGLGVTPSAWIDYKALQTTGASFIGYSDGASNNQAQVVANAYFTTGSAWKYIYTDHASRYMQYDGEHRWFTAPSGTAGNAISFTQALTLDASGNLAVGTTTVDERLRLNGDSNATSRIRLQNQGTTLGWFGSYLGITALGNGNDLFVANATANALIFGTNGTERARITSGGYSKFSNDGTYVSSTGAYHEFRNTDAAQPILYLTATSGSYTGQTIYINNTRAASSAYKFYSANADAVEQFYVRGDGVLYAQNTTIQSLSDGRLKENVRNATEGLQVVNALRPVRYDWKAGYGNDRKDQLGFIAQEVEAVFPDAVSEWSKAEGDEEAYKTVGPGALIPVLVKAIQELTARVAQLESK
jgi:hypothetical protein